jgi:peroxiredoxin (alkyl hydroperoxide reductase subunit C)
MILSNLSKQFKVFNILILGPVMLRYKKTIRGGFIMSLVGRPAPDFELEGYFNGQFSKYKLSDFRKKWVILLFYPLDFTFVCPTEVLNFSAAAERFNKLNCQIFGISVDSVYVHKAWVDTKREDGGLGGTLSYPLLSDLNKVTARDYGILIEDEGVALRGLFLISPEGVIMHSTINSLSVGRSVTEAMRVMKAFQFVSSHVGQVCPADWEEGKDTMMANSDGMKKYLTNH